MVKKWFVRTEQLESYEKGSGFRAGLRMTLGIKIWTMTGEASRYLR